MSIKGPVGAEGRPNKRWRLIGGILILGILVFGAVSVWGDTHYVDPAGSNTPPYTTPATAAHSIQDAIDAATGGDTVDVAAGTYAEHLIISKSNISLLGENKETTIIDATQDPSWSVAKAAILIGDATYPWVDEVSNVTVSGFTIQNAALQTGGDPFGGELYGPGPGGLAGIQIYNSSDNTIENNILINNYWQVWLVAEASVTGLECRGNRVANNIMRDSEQDGVYLYSDGGVSVEDTEIENNHIYNLTGEFTSGVEFWGWPENGTPAITGTIVQGNYIHDCTYGVRIRSGVEDISGTRINYNSIVDMTSPTSGGLRNYLTITVNATNNWWGTRNGPEHSGNTFNVGSQGDKVSDNATYVPWLNAVYPGGSSWGPVYNPSASYYSSIQAAIDAASAGHTITCAAGTYSPTSPIAVDKQLTLTGNTITPSNVVVNAPTSGIDRDCFQVKANGVTIQGFKIAGAHFGGWGNGWQNAGIMVGNDGATHGTTLMDDATTYDGLSVTITHNEITDCENGMYLYEIHDSTITYNTITNGHHGCFWCGDGIHLYFESGTEYVTDNNVSHNTMDNVRNGMMFNSGNNVITHDFSGNNVEHNTMTNVWNTGIIFQAGSGTAGSPITIKNNSIDTSTGAKPGDEQNENGLITVYTDYTEITGNTVTNSLHHGIWVDGSHHTVTGNTVTSNAKDGIHVGHYKEVEPVYGAFGDLTRTDINIHFNNIYGNTEDGLDGTQADEEVDAKHNYWGDDSGPSGGLADPATGTLANGTGDRVSANVLFDPWTGMSTENVVTEEDVEEDKTVTNDEAGVSVHLDDMVPDTATTDVTIAEYTDNPAGIPSFGAGERYIDVQLSDPDAVNELTITFDNMAAGTIIYFYRPGAGWLACSDQTFTNGSIEVKVRDDTIPTLEELRGGIFAEGSAPGDINGDGAINVLDARLCLQIVTGFLTPTAAQRAAADVDGDGDVDLVDAEWIAKYVIHIVDELGGG